jgi:hypothetical protein
LEATTSTPEIVVQPDLIIIKGACASGRCEIAFKGVLKAMRASDAATRATLSVAVALEEIPTMFLPMLKDFFECLKQISVRRPVRVTWVYPQGSQDIYDVAKFAAVLYQSPTLALEIQDASESLRQFLTSPTQRQSVFISHASEDAETATQVLGIIDKSWCDVFLAQESLRQLGQAEYMRAIDDALTKCRHMIVVANRAERVPKSWVEAEWRLFANEKRSGRKSGNILTVIGPHCQLDELPASLRYFEVINLQLLTWPMLSRYIAL